MTRFQLVLLASALVAVPPVPPAQSVQPAQGSHLSAFSSDSEFVDWLRELDARRAALYAARTCRAAVTISSPARPYNGGPPFRGVIIAGRVTQADGHGRRSVELGVPKFGAYVTTDTGGAFVIRLSPSSVTRRDTVMIVAQERDVVRQGQLVVVTPGDSISVDFRLCSDELRRRELGFAATALSSVVTAAASAADEGITNVQHAGVDEGGIVKRHGDHLVILRRGRLFTVRVTDDALTAVAAVDAYASNINPRGDWYDEMLVSGDRVVVIGYSYGRGGSEIGVFRIDGAGRLAHDETYHLRSNDYYSSRNYASRLIGDRLILYSPISFGSAENATNMLPAIRRWSKDTTSKGFVRIGSARQVFRPARALDPEAYPVMHALTSCKVSVTPITCESSVVVGPASRVFYASPTALYLWVSEKKDPRASGSAAATAYRMPLDGSAPTAVRVAGTPVDQFSFLEKDGWLNVVVRDNARGEWMWSSEFAEGNTSLLRVPISAFGDGSQRAAQERYRSLPSEGGRTFQNRFVGEHLLYGNGMGWGYPRSDGGLLYVTRINEASTRRIALEHGVDRIEAMGREALVVGSDGAALHFSGIRLGASGAPSSLSKHHTMGGVTQGETRSHGFFYRVENDSNGVLGLPVSGEGAYRAGYEQLFRGSASVAFVRNSPAGFTPVGKLSSATKDVYDNCRASCVDWYGNARPIFMGGRMYALLGYDLVEGLERRGTVVETRRVNFAPQALAVNR